MPLIQLCVFSLLLVKGVFAADTDEEKTIKVPVMEGHSVTLPTDRTEIQKDDQIKWRFNNNETLLAELYMRYNINCINNDIDNERFRGRLKLDNQTGSLTITNITSADSGVYLLEIINSSGTFPTMFRVIVSLKRESVTSGNTTPNLTSERGLARIIIVAPVVILLIAVAVIKLKNYYQAGQEVQEAEAIPINNNNMAHDDDGDGVSVPLAAVSVA